MIRRFSRSPIQSTSCRTSPTMQRSTSPGSRSPIPQRRPCIPRGPKSGRIFVPPSGHVAGIYARVDDTRGVFKAPANEVVLGALELQVQHQQGAAGWPEPARRQLHPRAERRHPRFGALAPSAATPTASGAISTYAAPCSILRESIDEGTQWAVFEPNDHNLWAKITRNVSAFLDDPVAGRHAVRQHGAGGVLRQVRRRDQPAGVARDWPGGHRDRRGHRAPGRVRDLPHQPVAAAEGQLTARTV